MKDIHSNQLQRKNQRNHSTVSCEPTLLPDFHRHKVDDCIYHFPNERPFYPESVEFEEMSLSLNAGGQHILLDTNNGINRFVAANESDEYDLLLTLSGLPLSFLSSQYTKQLVALYRKGCTQPLYIGKQSLVNDELLWRVESAHLTPGEYFISLSDIEPSDECQHSFNVTYVSEHCLYHFEVLQHGARMPRISGMGFYTLPPNRIHLTCYSTPALSEKDEFRFICYNSCFHPISRGYCEVYEEGNNLSFNLPIAEWPVDDHYHVVLLHNNEPFYLCNYALSDGQKKSLDGSNLCRTDWHYQLAKVIDTHPNCDAFYNEPGLLPLKTLLLDYLAYPKRNRQKTIVVSGPIAPSMDFMRLLASLLHDDSQPAFVHGQTLVEQWEEGKKKRLAGIFRTHVHILHHMEELLDGTRANLLAELDAYIQRSQQIFCFIGSDAEISLLMKHMPLTAHNLLNNEPVSLSTLSISEQMFVLGKHLRECCFELDKEGCKNLQDYLYTHQEAFEGLNTESLINWANKRYLPLLAETAGKKDFSDLSTPQLALIDFTTLESPSGLSDFDLSMKELNEMVGLSSIKESLKTMFNRTKFDQVRIQAGLPALDENRCHMIFTGNPGTGKTTVARLIGKIFKSLGLLSNGDVILAERSNMVGKYLGHTEDQMNELLERAKGNVLFIDEAYSLCDNTRGERNDFGCRALECLLTALTDNHSDMIIIMAGYEKEMTQMLEMNPGMKGRFPYLFHFEDYTEDDLFQITKNKLESKLFTLDNDAQLALRDCIRQTYASRDAYFHNARWAEQLAMEGIVSAMADRLFGTEVNKSTVDFRTVTESDIRLGYKRLKPIITKDTSTKRQAIGFH